MSTLPITEVKMSGQGTTSTSDLTLMVRFLRILFVCLLLLLHNIVEAKRYPFIIDKSRDVSVSRSTAAGTKMVSVIAYGRSFDAALDQAMLDAVVALTFDGVKGLGELDGCPAVLYGGRNVYYQNKDYFDTFFKKGDFLNYVEKVNSTNPMGADNVKTSKGRRIRIQLIVNWKGLSEHFKEAGFKTAISELSNF